MCTYLTVLDLTSRIKYRPIGAYNFIHRLVEENDKKIIIINTTKLPDLKLSNLAQPYNIHRVSKNCANLFLVTLSNFDRFWKFLAEII